MTLSTRLLALASCLGLLLPLTGCESTGNNPASNVDRTGPGAPIYTQGEQIDTDFYNSID